MTALVAVEQPLDGEAGVETNKMAPPSGRDDRQAADSGRHMRSVGALHAPNVPPSGSQVGTTQKSLGEERRDDDDEANWQTSSTRNNIDETNNEQSNGIRIVNCSPASKSILEGSARDVSSSSTQRLNSKRRQRRRRRLQAADSQQRLISEKSEHNWDNSSPLSSVSSRQVSVRRTERSVSITSDYYSLATSGGSSVNSTPTVKRQAGARQSATIIYENPVYLSSGRRRNSGEPGGQIGKKQQTISMSSGRVVVDSAATTTMTTIRPATEVDAAR